MKNAPQFLKTALLISLLCTAVMAKAFEPARYYYQLKIYHLKTQAQEDKLDHYLKGAYLPALHKAGIAQVGVFKAMAQDTDKRVYVLIPYSSWNNLENTDKSLMDDKQYVV